MPPVRMTNNPSQLRQMSGNEDVAEVTKSVCETMPFSAVSLEDTGISEKILFKNCNRAENLLTKLDSFTLR